MSVPFVKMFKYYNIISIVFHNFIFYPSQLKQSAVREPKSPLITESVLR